MRTVYISRLNRLLNDFSDEVPDRVIHGPAKHIYPNGRVHIFPDGGDYKVRINWWNFLFGDLELIVNKELVVDPSLKKEILEFLETYLLRAQKRIEVQKQEDLTPEIKEETKQDIIAANAMIKKVLAYLQNSSS